MNQVSHDQFQEGRRNALRVLRVFLAAACLAIAPSAAKSQATTIALKPARAETYYRWVTFLTQSVVESHPNPAPGVTLRALRVVLASVEGDERIYLETITFGPEQCCNRIDRAAMIDFFDLAEKFSVERPLRGITFSKWLSPRTFSFKQKDIEFVAHLSERDSLVVERVY